MTGALCPLSLQTIFDDGKPLVGAEIRIYEAGTLTPKTVYVNSALQVAHPHPILTNGQGRVPAIYIKGGDYKVRLLRPPPHNEPIEEIDGIAGPIDLGEDVESYPLLDATAVLKTGDVLPSFGTGTRAGFARANGKTIGSALSGATEVAVGGNTASPQPTGSAYNLFVFLWEKDSSLPVYSGGTAVTRGSTAAADWNNNRTIALPDFRGLAVVGVDGMGNASSNRFGSLTYVKGNATTVGSQLGEALHPLSVGEMPSHTHGAFSGGAGSHTPIAHVTEQTAGQHSHTLSGLPNQTRAELGTGYTAASGGVDYGSTKALTTSSNGNHTHNVSVRIDAVPDHTHDITVYGQGGSAAHNNVQPSLLVTLYIKL